MGPAPLLLFSSGSLRLFVLFSGYPERLWLVQTRMGSSNTRLIAIALLSVCAMSIAPILIKMASINIVTIGLARLLIALFFITPFMFYRQHFSALTGRDWIGLIIVGVVFGLHWWTYFYTIKTAGASMSSIAMSTFGIHLLLMNWLIHQQHPRWIGFFSIAICFTGCLLVTPAFDLSNQITFGFLVGIVSAVFYATLPLLHRRIIHLPTLTRTWGQFAFAGLFFCAFWQQTDWQISSTDWWRLLVLGVLCTVISHGLWVKASSELHGVITSSVYYLYIPLTMLQSFFFLDEDITHTMIVGALLIIGANLLVILYPWLLRKRAGLLSTGKT